MNILQQIASGESKTLEYKKELPSNESIARTVVAFANTSGGKLIIGVDNKRKIVGIKSDNVFDLHDKIASIIFDKCYPNIIPEIYTLNIDGKILLVIEVHRGSLLPYYIKKDGKNKGTYIRLGATNRKAGFDNIIELERQKRNISFDEEADYEFDIESIDLSPIKKEFTKTGKELNTEKMLNLKLLINENGKTFPSKGLLIILGLYENASIKCSRFKGITMDVFIDKKEYDNDIFSQLENAENFILNHINIRAQINGLQRRDIPEIPVESIREALINAFIHRDYTNLGRDIKLGVYDDMVNIVSPGGFPNNILEDDILNGRSEIRNRVVAKVFKELGYIEQWGSGINRIKSYCIKHGLKKPVVEEKNDFVNVELYRKTENISDEIDYSQPMIVSEAKEYRESIGKVSGEYRKSTGKVPEKYRKIIAFLKNNETIETKDVENLFNLKDARSRRILKEMVDKGLIERRGAGRSTYYVLVSNNSFFR